jgi:flavin reductase (DIM6/NTAB) family NADH-FMN oxidoreductase RutF
MEDSRPQEFELAIGSAISAPEAFGASFDVAPSAEALELGEGLEGDPAIAFRKTLGMFATGVTVLTARVGEQVHGMTANAFMSVSLRPPLVLVSIDRRAKMGALLHEGTRFGVSVLEAKQTGLSDRFAGRVADDLPEAIFEVVHETPLVEGALAHLVAHVVRSYWGGDHSLFLGQVEFARYGEGRPLLFHGGRYERLTDDPRLLSLLPRELLEPILVLGAQREYADGDAIMRKGEAGSDLLLLVEGVVRVDWSGGTLTLGAGELIGEIEVLSPGGGRVADVTAIGAVRAVAVSREDLLAALEADSRAAIALIEVLAARFRGIV